MTETGNDSARREALRAQLAEVNSRARAQVAALWQIPLAYLGVIGIAFGAGDVPNGWTKPLAVGLAIVGALLIWAMCGWSISTRDAVGHIQNVERDLDLEVTAKTRHIGHELPHYLLVVLGMVGVLVLAFCL